MQHLARALLLLLPLMIIGCASGPLPADQRVLELRTIQAAAPVPVVFQLPSAITFVVPGGQGLMGDMKYTARPGSYLLHGSDAHGRYFRHQRKGISRSGAFAREGGLFIPHDRNARWGLWIVPNGVDVTYGLFGATGLGLAADQETSVVYQANIPLDLLPRVRQEIEPQLDQAGGKAAGAH